MGGNKTNGNKTKGNKSKKNRRKVDQFVDLDNGKGGRIYKLPGGEHLEIEFPDSSVVTCRIPGKFQKTVWFKKGQYVVVGDKFSNKVHDLLGRVQPNQERILKGEFDTMDDIDIKIGDAEDEKETDSNDDDEALGIKSKTVKTIKSVKTIKTEKAPIVKSSSTEYSTDDIEDV